VDEDTTHKNFVPFSCIEAALETKIEQARVFFESLCALSEIISISMIYFLFPLPNLFFNFFY